MQKYINNFQDIYGNALQGATISIFLVGTETLATLYEDDEITEKGNPLTTDQDGKYAFKAIDGDYDIKHFKSGYEIVWSRDIQLLDRASIKATLATLTGISFNFIQDATPTASDANEWWLETDTGSVYKSTASGTGSWSLQYQIVLKDLEDSVSLPMIDLNGGTDIGADLTTSDLILVDDGAGGTNRKATLSRIVKLTSDNLDIDGQVDIGADLETTDLFYVDDGANGTNRKSALSRLITLIHKSAQSLPFLIYRMVNDESTGSQVPLGGGGSDWELADDIETEFYLGNGNEITELNGIFSFTSTGIWEINFYGSGYASDTLTYVYLYLKATSDNSTYNTIEVGTNESTYGAAYFGSTGKVCLKITDISNQKILLGQDMNAANGYFQGSGVINNTYISFKKLADL